MTAVTLFCVAALLLASSVHSLPNYREWNFKKDSNGVYRPTNPLFAKRTDEGLTRQFNLNRKMKPDDIEVVHALVKDPQGNPVDLNVMFSRENEFICNVANYASFNWNAVKAGLYGGKLCSGAVQENGFHFPFVPQCMPWQGFFNPSAQQWGMFYGQNQTVFAGYSYVTNPSPSGLPSCLNVVDGSNQPFTYSREVAGWTNAVQSNIGFNPFSPLTSTYGGWGSDVGACQDGVALSNLNLYCRVEFGSPVFYWAGGAFAQPVLLDPSTAIMAFGVIDSTDNTQWSGTQYLGPPSAFPNQMTLPSTCTPSAPSYCAAFMPADPLPLLFL